MSGKTIILSGCYSFKPSDEYLSLSYVIFTAKVGQIFRVCNLWLDFICRLYAKKILPDKSGSILSYM